jgi:hypothetical protein
MLSRSRGVSGEETRFRSVVADEVNTNVFILPRSMFDVYGRYDYIRKFSRRIYGH